MLTRPRPQPSRPTSMATTRVAFRGGPADGQVRAFFGTPPPVFSVASYDQRDVAFRATRWFTDGGWSTAPAVDATTFRIVQYDLWLGGEEYTYVARESPAAPHTKVAAAATWRCGGCDVAWVGTAFCWSCGEHGEPGTLPHVTDGWDAEPGRVVIRRGDLD